VAVALAALAGLLLPHAPRVDPRRLTRLTRLTRPTRPTRPPGGRRGAAGGTEASPVGVAVPTWVPRAVGVGAGLAVLTGHGVWATVLVVATAALAAPGMLAASVRRRREFASARELPRVADLLAACLQAGLPLPAAAAEVVRVVDEPSARRLRHLAVRSAARDLDNGSLLGPPGTGCGSDPPDGWWRLERAVVRAAERGAPLADVLAALAADERDRARWAAEEAARRAGVRAVGPLAACFLPAFVLVGVVPIVVGVAGTVLGDLR
jgi:Flp pilus assembly protein TadB